MKERADRIDIIAGNGEKIGVIRNESVITDDGENGVLRDGRGVVKAQGGERWGYYPN